MNLNPIYIRFIGLDNSCSTISLSTNIFNDGSADAEGVVVAFFSGDPETDGSYLCADFYPEFLNPSDQFGKYNKPVALS